MSGDRAILIKSGETSTTGSEIHAVALGGGAESTPVAAPIIAQGMISPEFVAPRYNNNEYNQYGVQSNVYTQQPQTNVYTQQPGQPVVIYAQGTTALPPVNMPQSQYAQQYGQPYAQQQVAGPPIGYWRDGICDCCSNIWPSCCCTCCFHGAWLAAQISQKINFIPFRYLIMAYLVRYDINPSVHFSIQPLMHLIQTHILQTHMPSSHLFLLLYQLIYQHSLLPRRYSSFRLCCRRARVRYCGWHYRPEPCGCWVCSYDCIL